MANTNIAPFRTKNLPEVLVFLDFNLFFQQLFAAVSLLSWRGENFPTKAIKVYSLNSGHSAIIQANGTSCMYAMMKIGDANMFMFSKPLAPSGSFKGVMMKVYFVRAALFSLFQSFSLELHRPGHS